MANLIATGNGKAKKTVKNVAEIDIDRKTEELYDLGYTVVTVEQAPVKTVRKPALPANVDRGSIWDMLG